jgi:hypothetical protein
MVTAAAAGSNIPDLQVRLTLGEEFPAAAQLGRPGVRTHGTIALLLGVAAYERTCGAVIAELARASAHRGPYHVSREQLTPMLRDPPSAAALVFVIAQALASPTHATGVASNAVSSGSITPKAFATAVNASGRT